MFEKAHKGLNRDEAGVACPWAVVPGRFQMLQKVHHERRIELLQAEGRGGDPQSCTRKLQKQLKGVGIAVTGMRTRATLQWQALAEKGSEMGSDGGHGATSSTKRSPAWAMWSISCGERSKYQKVLLTWAWPRYVIKASVWLPICEFPTEGGTAHCIRRGEGNACMTLPIRQPGRLTAGLFARPHGRSVTPPAPCVQQQNTGSLP